MLKLYNSLTKKKELFRPIKEKRVGLYTCGPTVYWYAHIGNLRTYFFEDVLKRTLLYNNYKVKHVMNITDVGHLTSDSDTGEDKMEKGAKREKKTAWQIANFYKKAFLKDICQLNIIMPDILIQATDTIKDQIKFIKILEKKGFTYKIKDGVYFDTSKLESYGKLWPKKMKLQAGKRVKMVKGKKNKTDFALWKFTKEGEKRQMEWKSPWGKGFPGWHTECIVMAKNKLNIPFDIHCGGIDHVLIHHTNEIAQAEAAYGKMLANYWIHGEFLNLKEGKMAKTTGNIITLNTLSEKNISPLALRYFYLGAHYRSRLSFSFEALKGAENALEGLYEKIQEIKESKEKGISEKGEKYKKEFLSFINDDLNTPSALALLWALIKDKNVSSQEKQKIITDFDKVLGLNLEKVKKVSIADKLKKLLKERESFRQKKDWLGADKIRKEIENKGYKIEDTKKGPKIKKI